MSYDFTPFQTQANQLVSHTQSELAKLRSGRAHTQMLDEVLVEAYGTTMKLVEIGSVAAPDPHLLTISPWDKSLLGAIEKGIQIADLNLNPVVEGTMIRIAVPPLTEERRLELVKVLHQKIEAAKATLRNIRTDTKREIESQKGQPGISDDVIERDLEQLDAQHKKIQEQLESLGTHKETELMTL